MALLDEVSQSVINISAVVGKSGFSGQSGYSAAKVSSFSELCDSLWENICQKYLHEWKYL